MLIDDVIDDPIARPMLAAFRAQHRLETEVPDTPSEARLLAMAAHLRRAEYRAAKAQAELAEALEELERERLRRLRAESEANHFRHELRRIAPGLAG